MDVIPSLAADDFSNLLLATDHPAQKFALFDSAKAEGPPQAYFALERPAAGAVIAQRGKVNGFGWLVSAHPVGSVAVLLNGAMMCYATLGIPRPDVAELFAPVAKGDDAGFWFEGDVPQTAAPGAATLSFQITLSGQVLTHETPVEIVAAPVKAPPKPAEEPAEFFRLEFEEASFDGDLLCVSGWAFSNLDVDQIEVHLNGRPIGAAMAGLARADVALAIPGFDAAKQSGFRFEAPVPAAELQGGDIAVIARNRAGASREARRGVERINSLSLFCDEIGISEDGHLHGAGWAVCATGVTAIHVEIDGRPACLARIGLSRPDVGKTFPRYKNAVFAGYQIDCRLDGDWAGEHSVRIIAEGGDGETRTVEQSVIAHAPSPDQPAAAAAGQDGAAMRFHVDLPPVVDGHACETVRGFLPIGGWAFARAGIVGIDVYIDGEFHAGAFTGIRRDDIQAVFPDYDALLSGFGILIPPQALKPGRHRITLFFRDKDGQAGEWTFTVDAELAPEGPGPWQIRRKMSHAEIDLGRQILQARGYAPVWTLVIPLASAEPKELALLRETLECLDAQAYPVWRAIIPMPAVLESESGRRSAAALLRPDGAIGRCFAGADHLLPRLTFMPDAADRPLADLTGPGGLLAWMMPGDRLGEDALLELSIEAAVQPEADFFYADDRRRDPADGVVKAFFKPDWSPDLLLATNYIGRLWAASASLLARAGLTLASLSAETAYDTVLRLTEAARAIVHVAKVLGAAREDETQDAVAARLALLDAAARRGVIAHVAPGCVSGAWRTRYELGALEAQRPKVSVIIPSIAARGLIKIAVESLRNRTDWPDLEIVILDNIRDDSLPEARAWKDWMRDNADCVLEIDEDFNWSRFNNLGAARATGEFLLFLNDDIEVTGDPGWLRAMLAHAQRPEIGVVGPQLLYPDGRVQHAGVFLGNRVGRHAFRFLPADAPGPFGLALTQRNVISVTGACMLMRRAVFDTLGGFDENHPVINNDLDFCLRVRSAGLRVLYTPDASLVHHEMASRAKLRDEYNSEHFDRSWKPLFLKGDPYFHPYLSRDYEDYQTDSEPVRVFQAGHPLIRADDVTRILAVKVDHIGDFLLSLPAFRRIKARFPRARLTVLAARASVALAALEPCIDEVIEFNFFHARSEKGALDIDRGALEALRETLAPKRFDLALDLRRQPDTRVILQYTGARWLAGFDQGYRNKWLDIAMEFEGDLERNLKRNHAATSLVQFIDVVASACASDRTLVSAPPLGREQARSLLRRLPGMAAVQDKFYERPIVALHTGAGALNKQWPADHFAGLIDLLAGELDVSLLVIGGPDESDFAASVTAGARHGGEAVSLVGQTSLRELATVLLACDLYVGNDSGPKHMAAGLGVPTIGIHSGSVDAGEWGALGPLTATVQRAMTCSPCYIAKASDCPRSMACLKGLGVGDVYRACRRMLALSERARFAPAAPSTLPMPPGPLVAPAPPARRSAKGQKRSKSVRA